MRSLNVYRVFAENLRERCDRIGTIAEVCRLTGINRQQFNKYLAGTNLPSQKTMTVLAGFFDCSESSFFQPGKNNSHGEQHDETSRFLYDQTSNLLNAGVSTACLDQGLYKVYSAWLPDPRFYFVFTIEIFKKNGFAHYHWHFSFKGNPFYKERPLNRWVRGFVLTDGARTSLIGKMLQPNLPGLMVLQLDKANAWPNSLSSGIVTGFMPNNLPFAGTVVIQKLPSETSRIKALRSDGVVSKDSGFVSEQIQQLMQNQTRPNANHMTAIDMMKAWNTVAISQ